MLGAASAVDDGNADATGGTGRIRGSHNLERLPPLPNVACSTAATWSNAVRRAAGVRRLRSMRNRLWIMSALVFTMLIVVGTVIYVSARPGSTGQDWHQATSPSGRYVAEFPNPPTNRTLDVPNSDMSAQLMESQSGDTAFAFSETALNGNNPHPLDEAVDGSIESVRAAQEASSGGPVTATEISTRRTGDFEGVETREFRYTVIGGDSKKSTISSLIFYRDGFIVQAMVVADGEADSETADRFLASVASRPK